MWAPSLLPKQVQPQSLLPVFTLFFTSSLQAVKRGQDEIVPPLKDEKLRFSVSQ